MFTFDPGLNDVSSASNPLRDTNRRNRTIVSASTALHTAIDVGHKRLAPFQHQNAMWTDRRAHTASHAGICVEGQGDNIRKIPECFHLISFHGWS